MGTFILLLRKRGKLSDLALLLSLFFFLPHTVLWFLWVSTEHISQAVAGSFGLWHFFLSWLLLGHPIRYLLICGGMSLLLVVAALREGHLWKTKGILFLAAAMLLIFMLAPYRTAVVAADGYQMMVPTAPSLLFRGLKNAQAMGEQKPCRYELLGWQEKTLFYQSVCYDDQTDLWQVTPLGETQAKERKAALPTTLFKENLTHQATLEQVRSIIAPSARNMFVPEPGMLSPDGKWVALISKHLYSAEDVLILSEE